MTKNLLIGNSSQNRAGKYLYYGAYDTDDIQSLVAGEIGIFWANKTAGPDADTGAYVGGGNNDDLTSLSGNNVDIADTPNVVTERDRFYFAQGRTGGKTLLGMVINPQFMNFKVSEYVAPVKKIQTVTLTSGTFAAGKTISFSLYSKNAPAEAVGTVKSYDVEYTVPVGGTATSIGAAIKAMIETSTFYNRYIYSVSETHSSDVVFTITWGEGKDGDIKNNTYATCASAIATSTAFKVGNGTGSAIVALEKECAIHAGYNPAVAASKNWSDNFSAVSTSNYHLITITWKNDTSDKLGLNPITGIEQVQYIAIDTTETGMVLLEEIVGLLTDMVEKRAVSGAA
jgi:hypothetical protein